MACTDLQKQEGSPASATFSQAPGEQDAAPAFLPFPFSLLEESELRERKWSAQESSSTPGLPASTPSAPVSGNGTPAVYLIAQARDLKLLGHLSSHLIHHLVHGFCFRNIPEVPYSPSHRPIKLPWIAVASFLPSLAAPQILHTAP